MSDSKKTLLFSITRIIGLVLFLSTSAQADYRLAWNKDLSLCHEFLKMVNSQDDNYLAITGSIDSKFEQFHEVKKKEVDKKNTINL